MAGPVVVTALALPKNLKFPHLKLKLRILKIIPKQREFGLSGLKSGATAWVALVSPKIIDE